MESHEIPLSVKKVKKKPRTRDPIMTESLVFQYLHEQSLHQSQKYSSFHELQTALNMSPGKLQAAVNRCLASRARYKIFESAIISPKTKRKIRIFAANPQFLPEPEDSIDMRIFTGKIIPTPDKKAKILPLRMDNQTVRILKHIIAESTKFKTIGDLFSQSVMTYLQTLPNELIVKAINQAKMEEN